jgi:hypothetical protein
VLSVFEILSIRLEKRALKMTNSLPTSPEPWKERASAAKDQQYGRKLYDYSAEVREPHFLEYRHLQRINLAELQNELAKQKAGFSKRKSVTPAELQALRTTLHSYSKSPNAFTRLPVPCICSVCQLTRHNTLEAEAIRDYEYILSLAQMTGSERDDRYNDLREAFPEVGLDASQPFNSLFRTFRPLATIANDPLRDLLKSILPRGLTWTRAEKARHVGEFIDHKTPEDVSPVVDGIARLVISVVAGAALIAPVVVMELGTRTVNKSLITTSVAVVVFAIALAFGVRASNTETLVSTATYAAVLVVFVGTSAP